MNANITRRCNEILVNEKFDGDYDLRGLLSAVHKATTEEKLSDVVLNFKHCSHVGQGPMVLLCAQILKHREHGINFTLIEPESLALQRLFYNTNWAHFIDPRFEPSRFYGPDHLPATRYQDESGQGEAVNKIVDVILRAVPHMDRRSLASFEWSINEITDNVLVHAKSPVGGLVQVQTFARDRKAQFVVADAGVGILKTLQKGHPDLTRHEDALEKAIREGATSSKDGQGNGLYGSFQMCWLGESAFELHSGYAGLIFVPKSKKPLRAEYERLPCDGTLVAVTIDFSKPKLLEEALRFQGRQHKPVDFVETKYEQSGDGDMCFKLVDESPSFGSRMAGKPVRTKLLNLYVYGMHSSGRISVDLSNVPIMSSSFADEVFGKLFFEVGAVEFTRRFELTNVEDIVRQIIDKAIAQRVSTGFAD